VSTAFSAHVMAPKVERARAERSRYSGNLVVFVSLAADGGDVVLSGTPTELLAFANDFADAVSKLSYEADQ